MEQQKRRVLLEAMVEELVQGGYKGTSGARACAAAAVTREEFETEFADTDAALLAAYEELTAGILARTAARCGEVGSWPERIRTGLGALLEELAARPRLAQAVTRSFSAIRPAAYERFLALGSLFVPYEREGIEYTGAVEELPAEVELLAVGAAETIIFGELEAGRAERLPAMLPEILFSLLAPFLGADRAAREMRSATAFG